MSKFIGRRGKLNGSMRASRNLSAGLLHPEILWGCSHRSSFLACWLGTMSLVIPHISSVGWAQSNVTIGLRVGSGSTTSGQFSGGF